MNEARLQSMPHFAIAFDLETHLIQPGLVAPPIVLGSAAEPRILRNLEDILSIVHNTLGDRTLRVERDSRDLVIVFSHRCKLCNKRHCVRVDEPMFLGAADTKAYVDLIYSEVEGLLQRPCPNMEIGKKA